MSIAIAAIVGVIFLVFSVEGLNVLRTSRQDRRRREREAAANGLVTDAMGGAGRLGEDDTTMIIMDP